MLILFRVIDYKIEKLLLSNPSEGLEPLEGLNSLRNNQPKGNSFQLSINHNVSQ